MSDVGGGAGWFDPANHKRKDAPDNDGDDSDAGADAAPSRQVHKKCRPEPPPPPPRLAVAPANHDFQDADIGVIARRDFLVLNSGGGILQVGNVGLLLNLRGEFAIIADNATGAHLHNFDDARVVTVTYTPTLEPQRAVTLRLPSNDPTNAGICDVPITGNGRFLMPDVEFVLADGTVADYVRIGLWNDAWNPADGVLYNAEAQNANFVGRDERSFSLRVTDPGAAARGRATVTIQWWTLRIPVGQPAEDDDHPGIADLTLIRVGHSNTYISQRIMLVTDDADAGQGTHTGLAGGGVVARGQADHRLRRVTVSALYRLDGSVRVQYTHQNVGRANPVVEDATLFNRVGDERRRLWVHLVNVRQRAGAVGRATTAQLDIYEGVIHAIYARAGIFVQMDRVNLVPPPACTGWARRVAGGMDPGIVVAAQERSQAPPQIVPHPTQTALIQAANVQPGHIYLFFVANIYDLVTGEHAGGEAFYLNQTVHPGAPGTALADLNVQLQAQTLAGLLWSDGRNRNAQRRGRLDAVLAAARLAAAAHPLGGDLLAQATAFLGHVTTESVLMTNDPWLRARLVQLLLDAQANPYTSPAYTTSMTAARGCAFIVRQALLHNYLAPAHELTHITTNLNNVADGHFDLEILYPPPPPPILPYPPPDNTVGYDLPGHIDGKNLMHRYALNAGNPAGVNLPKRLWDQQATNAHRGNMLIPPQITAILGNAIFILPY